MADPKKPADWNTRTNLQETDWFNLFVGDSPNNPQAGATDYKAQFSALVNLMVKTLTRQQIAELLKAEVAIRVSNTGSVTNTTGRLQITGTQVENGLHELQCPSGWVWSTAVAGGHSDVAPRTVNCTGYGSSTLRVAVYDENGSLRSYSYSLMGRLAPA